VVSRDVYSIAQLTDVATAWRDLMRNTFYAMLAASLAMLATSGIVALATAAPPERVKAPVIDQEMSEAEIDAWISAQINAEYRKTFTIH